MIARRGETYELRPEERTRDLILASLAVAYTLFMIYAGGLKFILLSAILFAPGTVLYFIARREQGKPVFDKTIGLGHVRRHRRRRPSTASTVWRPAPSPSNPTHSTHQELQSRHNCRAKSSSACTRKSASCAR